MYGMPARVGSESGSGRFGAYVSLLCDSYDELMGKIHDIPYGIKNDAWNITEIEVEQETISLPPSIY